MRLTAYDVEKIPGKNYLSYKSTEMTNLIEEFIASGMKCAKVEGWTHKNAYTCANSIQKNLQRTHRNKMYKAISRKGEVFLIKLDV